MWKIYVGNLSSRIRELELSNEFRPYGLVRSIWIARNPPGYAFVEFDSRQEAHDAIAALDGKHGWRVEMSQRSSGGIRSKSSSRDTRCRECGSHRHNAGDCRFRASQSSRSSSHHSRAHTSRDSPMRRHSRSRSRQHDDQLNERSPRNRENSFPVKSKCSRSPRNVQNRSPSLHSGVNEDGPFQKIGSSKFLQNDLIDLQTDGYHSSKECEHSSSPRNRNGTPDVQKGFESDGKSSPVVSEPDLSGSSEHLNCGDSPSP